MDNEESEQRVGWYPCPPAKEIPLHTMPIEPPKPTQEEDVLAKFNAVNVKFMNCNRWNSIPKEKMESIRRNYVKGVEIRQLPPGHFLAGEYGLFATEKFSRFDVIGEYAGKIVGDDAYGHYVAALEDKGHDDSLGVDAEFMGNEMRFINSYLNVAFKANVSMRTAYVNTYPHIVIVCTEDIDVGDELLLDYGDAYNKAYLLPKPIQPQNLNPLSTEELISALPFTRESSDEEDNKDSNQESS